MIDKKLNEIYLEIHQRLCELLGINVKPLEGVKISNKNTCDENFIYIKKECLKRYSDEKKNLVIIAGILAHEDMHYIISEIYPFVKEYHENFTYWCSKLGRFLKIIDILDEFVATLGEFIIRYEYCEKIKVPLKKIREHYISNYKYFLDNFKLEYLGYVLAYALILQNFDKEIILKILKEVLDHS